MLNLRYAAAPGKYIEETTMRKLTADYFVKQIARSQTPADFVRSCTKLGLFWLDHFSYQWQNLLKTDKY